MRVLVTGSSGLIGRPLCQRLKDRADSVDEYDLRAPPDRIRPESFESRDILVPEKLRSAVANADGVIHLAAVSRAAPAEADPAMAHQVNVDGTRNVLEAIRSVGRRSPWFLLASSREVYGEVRTVPVSEKFPVQPKAVYGRTKAGAEAEVRQFAAGSPGRATILRLTNIYGSPWDHPERVIPAFLTRARNGEPLEVRGPEQILDFLHVDDAVEAIVRAIGRMPKADGELEILNIASGIGCSLGELAQKVVQLTGSGSAIREVAAATWTPSKFVADISRARSLLGWGPTIPLPQGLAELSSAFDSVSTG